ncbi:FAD-dependent oxidoreductase, partial [Candidatus Woesearchaeota archaeon]|nr:FAD-dependent oxidoreductase [Candidatus Woesearchaeota archaeon]
MVGRVKKILIIGCGGAGMFSAIVAAQLKPGTFKVTVLSDEKDIFCRCTTPYILSKKAELREAIQPDKMIQQYGVELIHDPAIHINPYLKHVLTESGEQYTYDNLVIATGARPHIPAIKGIDQKHVVPVRSSEDIKHIEKYVKKRKHAIVIGGGVIGVETAAALRERGMNVSLLEGQKQLIPGTTDPEFAHKFLNLLEKKGVAVHLSSCAEIINKNTVSIKIGKKTKRLKADLVVIATGVIPNVELAKESGIRVGKNGIVVDNKMRTNFKDIYSCGDCVTTKSIITGKSGGNRLASSAIQQAKIVGYQLAGFPMHYHGHTGSFGFQIFDKEYACAGLSEVEARKQHHHLVMIGHAKTTDKYKDLKEHESLEVKLIFAGIRFRLVGAAAYGKGVATPIEVASLAMGEHLS